MITKTHVMESLIGKPVVDAMVETLYNQNEDFPDIYQAYLDAIERLHTVLGPEAKHNIRKYDPVGDSRTSVQKISKPKTEAGIRTVPMLDTVYDAFMLEREEQEENGFNQTVIDGMTGFVFVNRNGGGPNPQTINRTIKRISHSYNSEEVVKAKRERRDPIILPDFSCHHLRHTFCTRLCEHETNLKVIQAIMGHRNIETTMDIYAEATDRKKQQTFENPVKTGYLLRRVLARRV